MAKRLRDEGFVVEQAALLGDAIACVMAADYRLVLLDRRLPDGDGLSLLPVLRTRKEPAPVIVLTALDEIPDRVAGLDAGADDYLIKPFAIDELMARARVLLRRSPQVSALPGLKIGQLDYELSERRPTVNGELLVLPRRELAILDALVRRAGRVVMREHLDAQVYGFDDEISSNAMEAHISRLRKRLADAGARVVLHSVRGVGYMLKGA
jgi:DNA-binding response OmpR family regulator